MTDRRSAPRQMAQGIIAYFCVFNIWLPFRANCNAAHCKFTLQMYAAFTRCCDRVCTDGDNRAYTYEVPYKTELTYGNRYLGKGASGLVVYAKAGEALASLGVGE
jgi:hypothetical protein